MNAADDTYGLLAEFEEPEQLVAAAKQARQAGYQRIEGYSPFPVEGLADALGFRKTRIPLVVLLGGVFGCLGGFYLQYWVSVDAYPVNVGGRPFNSWPAFIPITFECTILCAALSALLGMLALNGLPTPYHPLFNVPRFSLASQERFFLCVEAADPQFDLTATREFLESLNPSEVSHVLA